MNSCPSHYYPLTNVTPNICDICDNSCLNCSVIPNNCMSCNTGFYFFNNTCKTTCPNRMYGDNTTWKCTVCNSLCVLCSGSATNCSECQTNGTGLSYLLNNTCMKNCTIGYFEDTNGGAGPNVCTNCSI
jgi:proprotein convertase subtilisin/kexin type 5